MDLSALNPPPWFRSAVYWLLLTAGVVTWAVDLGIFLGLIEGEPVGLFQQTAALVIGAMTVANRPTKVPPPDYVPSEAVSSGTQDPLGGP